MYIDEGSNGGTTYYEIIDLTVAKTYEFICTKSTNTSFNLSDLPDTAKYIVIQGTLNNSEGNDNMKA